MSIFIQAFKKSLNLGLLLGFVLALAGCSTPSLRVSLQASDQLNQDQAGSSYSVVVRFYQLTDPSIFEKAVASSLFREDESLLGVTLVSKEELTVSPGLTTELDLPKIDETEYLGVVAFYRQPGGSPIAVKKVKSGRLKKTTKLGLVLNNNEVFLSYR